MTTEAEFKVDRKGWAPGPWDGEPDKLQWYRKKIDVQVHGGLTYSKKCHGPVCHVAEPGFPEDVWWLGFDCGHHMDLRPESQADYLKGLYPALASYQVYRDVAYIQAETNRLAEQLA
jgi:hypothetical protein